MDHLRNYIVCVSAAAVLCSVIGSIIEKTSTSGKLIKILCGVFMAVSVLSPVADFRLKDLSEYMDNYNFTSAQATDEGVQMAMEAQTAVIKQQLQSYILDKAADLGLDVEVEVKLTYSQPPKPDRVDLCGEASPYKKQLLTTYITENLGITRENLRWT